MYILFAQVDYSRMRRLYSTFQTQKSQHASRTLVNHFCREFLFFMIYFSFFFLFLFVLSFFVRLLFSITIIQSNHLCETSYQALRLYFQILPANRDDNNNGGMTYDYTYAKTPYHHDNHDRSRGRRKKEEERKEGNHSLMFSRCSHHSRDFFTKLLLPPLSLSPSRPLARRSPVREERTSSHIDSHASILATRKRSG